MNNEDLVSELELLVETENVSPNPFNDLKLPDSWKIPPVACVSPRSAEQVAGIVRAAEAAGTGIVTVGGGTHIHTGYPPGSAAPYLLLQTGKLNRILDYQHDDLTVTCEPGLTLDELQTVLRERRQHLALDVPLSHLATLGGIVSTNSTGFWRPTYGAPRDLLIGFHAAMSGGEQIKGGGRVVKNVAGYDLCKVFNGAWGTLGVITELTFKVRPLPEVSRAVAWHVDDIANAAQIGLEIHQRRLAVAFVLAVNHPAPRLIIGLHGTAARVSWQECELARIVAEQKVGSDMSELEGAEVASLRDLLAGGADRSSQLAGTILCLPTELPELMHRLQSLHSLELIGQCATGSVSLTAREADVDLIKLVDVLRPASSNRIWTRIELDIVNQEGIDVWGGAGDNFTLHSSIKGALDPKGTFNRGRFLGRL